jgi:formate-dependent nitrite reductase membrane component NrfD
MVPDVEFGSYYGRPVLKPPAWDHRIAGYLFAGGLAAGASVVGAGADLTGRPALRRSSRLGALGALLVGTVFLITDLGRPERFHHMMRVAKVTSPMSVGTWILTAYGPGAGLAAAAELAPGLVRFLPARLREWWPVRLALRLVSALARPAGLSAAAMAPALGSYTSVLLSHTAVPGWNEVYRELPFVFAGSAAASGGGFGMIAAPVAEAGPARAFAVLGAAGELAAGRVMERRMGLIAEAYEHGRVGRLRRASEACTVAGLVGALTVARRSRAGAVVAGAAFLAGSALQRVSVFEAGVETTLDPRYVVVPQRERLNRAAEAAGQGRD